VCLHIAVRISPTTAHVATTARQLDLRLPDELTEATVNGRPVTVADIPTNRRQRFTLLYFGLPPQGAEVRLTIRGTGPISGRWSTIPTTSQSCLA
jgi:hypothetical protein